MPEFRFELTDEAAQWNYLVLKKYGLDLKRAIEGQSDSPLGYGSEFRDQSVLEEIFSKHPNWSRLKSILQNGSDWRLSELEEEKRKSDLEQALSFGNHKGAEADPEKLKSLIEKDVTYRYSLPLPLEKITNVPEICMAPMNIAPQHTIDEQGNIVSKDRLTHDQSYKWDSETSVNSRVDESYLLPCPFGQALRRYITHVVAARKKYPGCKIYSSKIDFKSAFRRMHISAKTALRACTQLPEDKIALIALRLTFGGRPCPSEWGALSETICDHSNAIMNDPIWDPEEVFNPQSLLIPETKTLPDEVPIAEAKELVFDVPVSDKGYADVFIDDIFAFVVDLPNSDNLKRLERGPLLAIDTVARPPDENEPIPRHPMASENKFQAEAGCDEIKLILGWFINHRELIISLPDNKYIAWTNALQELIDLRKTRASELETNLGRMVHVAQILPEIYHFLNRIRSLLKRAKNRRSIAVPDSVVADCQLLMKFLKRANDGISMNNLVIQMPLRVYRSDSCPHGLGGYSSKGRAWRYYLPKELLFRASNNLLEHIASIITVWIDILEGELEIESCILSMTDSSTSEGWARKSNFETDPENVDCPDFNPVEAEVRMEVCRHFAELCIESKIRHYPQWFPGPKNNVSDSLSRDDDRTDEELTHLLYLHFPEQMPKHFRISPLPNEIVSWLTSLLQKLPEKSQLQEKHTRTKIGRGVDGSPMPSRSASPTTSTSTTSPEQTESKSWEPLPWLSEKEDFHRSLMGPWLRAQSEVPFPMLHRPSGRMTGQTQQETTMESLDAFYRVYSELSEQKTLRKNSKKHSQQ